MQDMSSARFLYPLDKDPMPMMSRGTTKSRFDDYVVSAAAIILPAIPSTCLQHHRPDLSIN
jgi:hypothetical protein